MSDLEEERFEGTSLSRTIEEEEQGRTRHDSDRKHGKSRRREEEEEEEEDDEQEEDDEEDEDDDEDDDGDDEGVARGSKRQKVSCPTLLASQTLNTHVHTSVATDVPLLTASLM
jgi:transcription elongation factor SPT5